MANESSEITVRDLLTVNAIPGLGAGLYRRLVEHFGSWSQVVGARTNDLCAVPGIGEGLARAIHDAPTIDVSLEMEEARALGIELIPYTDARYPEGLKELHGAPLLLYVRGHLLPSDRLAMAIVGSRRCTYYGQSQAERLAFALSKTGFCIVSGMAHGIDATAHRAALRARGRTIAVLGCGLKHMYPSDHGDLAMEIAANGALVSELPLDVPPRAGNFPPRNRIIAGLALGTIVVEAHRKSGALITARWTTELNRQVYAVPGQADSPQSRGTHALLKDGAKLVESVEDVISELGPLGVSISTVSEETVDNPRALTLSGNEKRVFSALGSRPLNIDEVAKAVRLPIPAISSTLMVLEIRGLVRQLPGKRFVRP